MSIEVLLSRLEGVRGRNGGWIARCPAHADRTPSLTLRESDGKILLKCFAGCSVTDVVAAVGMEMTDLFPPDVPRYEPSKKVRFFATDLLKVLHTEAAIVMVAAFDMAKGKTLSETDTERLKVAYSRIDEAMESANA